jgi:hypothetical protein
MKMMVMERMAKTGTMKAMEEVWWKSGRFNF